MAYRGGWNGAGAGGPGMNGRRDYRNRGRMAYGPPRQSGHHGAQPPQHEDRAPFIARDLTTGLDVNHPNASGTMPDLLVSQFPGQSAPYGKQQLIPSREQGIVGHSSNNQVVRNEGGLGESIYAPSNFTDEPEPPKLPDLSFLERVGSIALRNVDADCPSCKKNTDNIAKGKEHLKKILSGKYLTERFVGRCELMLSKNVLGDECENCRTVDNEWRQMQQIEKLSKSTYKKDGTYAEPDDEFDTFQDMEGRMISRSFKELEKYKSSMSELQTRIATMESSNEALNFQLEEKENAFNAANAAAKSAEAEAFGLRTGLAEQKESLANAVKDAEARVEKAEVEATQLKSGLAEQELLAKAVERAEARAESAEAEVTNLTAVLAEQEKMRSKAVKAAEARAQSAEAEVTQLRTGLAEQKKLLTNAKREATQLRNELDEQKKLLEVAQSQVTSLETELGEQKKLLTKAEKDVGRLGAELDEQKNQFSRSTDEASFARQNLEAVNEQQNREISDLKKDKDELKAQLAQLSDTVKGLVAAGTMKANLESDGAAVSEEIIVEDEELSDAHQETIAIDVEELSDAHQETIATDVEEQRPTKPTKLRYRSGQKCFSTWMINFVSLLALLLAFHPMPALFNLRPVVKYGELVPSNNALNKTWSDWDYIHEQLPYEPPSPTAPSDPAPGDVPSSTTKFQKVITYAKTHPYKVAGYTAICASLGAYYYLGPGVYGIYVQFT